MLDREVRLARGGNCAKPRGDDISRGGCRARAEGRAARTSMLVRQPCIAVVPYLNLASSPSVLSLSVIGWLR